MEATERSGPSFAEAGKRSPCPPPSGSPQDPPPPPRGKHSALTRQNSLLFPRRDPRPLPLPPTPAPHPKAAAPQSPPPSGPAPRRGCAPKPRLLRVATPLTFLPPSGPALRGGGRPRGPEGAGSGAAVPLAVGRGNSRASGDPEAAAGRVGGRRGGGGRESSAAAGGGSARSNSGIINIISTVAGAWQQLGPRPRQERCLRRRLRAGFAAVAPRQRSRRAGL